MKPEQIMSFDEAVLEITDFIEVQLDGRIKFLNTRHGRGKLMKAVREVVLS